MTEPILRSDPPAQVPVITLTLNPALGGNSTITLNEFYGSGTTTITRGNLGWGLRMHPDGTISGTPGNKGTYLYTVTATDATATVSHQECALVVYGPQPVPTITSACPWCSGRRTRTPAPGASSCAARLLGRGSARRGGKGAALAASSTRADASYKHVLGLSRAAAGRAARRQPQVLHALPGVRRLVATGRNLVHAQRR
jgi:hypothetical protein